MSRPDETLPSEVDVIVLGTGLPESILAAACARVGFTVLHLDRNDYYGGPWASFNLEGIMKWAEEEKGIVTSDVSSTPITNFPLNDAEHLIRVNLNSARRSPHTQHTNIEVAWHVQEEEKKEIATETPEGPSTDAETNTAPASSSGIVSDVGQTIEEGRCMPESETEECAESKTVKELKSDDVPSPQAKARKTSSWTQQRIMNDWRRFSLDLAPRVLLGRGAMVDLLATSGVGRYAEFRSVDRLLTFYGGSLKMIPCSRSEVFQSSEITMIEKRMLMKFLTFCLNYDSEAERATWQEFSETPFAQFLSSGKHQLTERLRHYIQNALAMVSPTATTAEGLKSIHTFLMSTGRYGSSPFLWTLYGSGELPQCFCRLCAVFGGIYCLRRSVEGWILDADGNCVAIVTEGHRVNCRRLITDASYVPVELLKEENLERSGISRAILITDQTLYKSDGKEHATLLNYYADHLQEPVKILEAGVGGCVCPNGLHVVHLTTKACSSTAKSDLEPVVRKFFRTSEDSNEVKPDTDDDGECSPRLLWSLYFNCTAASATKEIAENIVVIPPVDDLLTFGDLVPKLRDEFNRLWPDTEFLPATPDQGASDVQDATPNDPGINGYTPDP